MMSAIDTLEVAKEMKAAGFTDGQAEALARRMREVELLIVWKLAEAKVEGLKLATLVLICAQALVIVSAVLALARALG